MKKLVLLTALTALTLLAFAATGAPSQAVNDSMDVTLSADVPVVKLAPTLLDKIAIVDLNAGAAYWCPPYTLYCRKDSQCVDYCGSVEWAVCENGCCACLG